jgi:hypothetical protein
MGISVRQITYMGLTLYALFVHPHRLGTGVETEPNDTNARNNLEVLRSMGY